MYVFVHMYRCVLGCVCEHVCVCVCVFVCACVCVLVHAFVCMPVFVSVCADQVTCLSGWCVVNSSVWQ